MKILVINGPNINMLGIREKNIYGAETYEDLKALLEKTFAERGKFTNPTMRGIW